MFQRKKNAFPLKDMHCLVKTGIFNLLAVKVGINKETGFTIKPVSFTIISFRFWH